MAEGFSTKTRNLKDVKLMRPILSGIHEQKCVSFKDLRIYEILNGRLVKNLLFIFKFFILVSIIKKLRI